MIYKYSREEAQRSGELDLYRDSRKENIAYLRDEAFKEQCECYKEYYGREPDTINAKFTLEEIFQKGYEAYLAEVAAKRD